jgi:hypothetical protein
MPCFLTAMPLLDIIRYGKAVYAKPAIHFRFFGLIVKLIEPPFFSI